MSQSPEHHHARVEDVWQQQPGHRGTGGAVTPGERPTAPGFATASMARRLGARLLDGLVVGVPVAVVVGVVVGITATTADRTGEPPAGGVIALLVLFYLAVPLAAALYDILLTARGGTLGKRWLGLRVVRRETGALPGGMAAFLRWLVFGAAVVVPVIGPVLMAVSPFFDSSGLRQGWHDLAAGTRVVDVRPEKGGRLPAA